MSSAGNLRREELRQANASAPILAHGLRRFGRRQKDFWPQQGEAAMKDDIATHEAVELMRVEHDQLRQLLEQIGATLRGDGRQQAEIDRLMGQLSELVESHFRHEEEGGYLKTALDRAPQLTVKAEKLKEQHAMLLEQIDKLGMLVHSGVESPAWWTRVEADFHQIEVNMRHHEEAEIDLAAEGFY